MFQNKFMRLIVLAGLSTLFLSQYCFALTRPETYMPHYVRALAEAKAFTNSWDGIPDSRMAQDTGWEAATSTGTAGAGVEASSATADSSAWGAVTVGTARGVATATANYQPGKFARGVSYAWLYWGDTLTVTSDTLPSGSPVALLFTLTLDAGTYTSASPWAYGVNDAEARSTFWIGGDVTTSQFVTVSYRDTQPASNQASMTVFTSVGSQIWIHGETFFNAMAAASSTTTGVYSFANVAETATFNVDVQTPGASYSTHSGVNYAIPEPGAFMLLGVGLAVVVALRRRSR